MSDDDDQDEEDNDLGPNLELPEIPKSIDAISFFNTDAKFVKKLSSSSNMNHKNNNNIDDEIESLNGNIEQLSSENDE